MRRWLHSRIGFALCILAAIAIFVAAVADQSGFGEPRGFVVDVVRRAINMDARRTGSVEIYAWVLMDEDRNLALIDPQTEAGSYAYAHLTQDLDFHWLTAKGSGFQHEYVTLSLLWPILTKDQYDWFLDGLDDLPEDGEATVVGMVQERPSTANRWFTSVANTGAVSGNQVLGRTLHLRGLGLNLLWLLAIAGAIDSWLHRKRWPSRHRDHTRCGACGYSREGLTADTCPECGEVLSTK